MDLITLAAAKGYVGETADSLGAVKGAPATIKSITEIDGGHRVTFEWIGTSGTKQTSEMTVKNGVSVTGISDKGNGVFTLLLSDGTETDPIQTVKGQKGDKGDKLTFNDLTDEEKAFLKGDSGFSPTITENENNTDKIYKLDVTTADGTFTTPNLKGADGQGGSGGDTYTGTSAVDLGGIKNNQVFDKTPLPDVIDMLLHPYEKPTMTLGINPVKTIYDTVSETLSSITINANVTKKSENIKEVRFYVDNVLVKTDTTHPTGGLVSYTHTFSPATNKTFNVKIECEDIKGTSSKISANTNVYFVGQSYYGVIEDDGSDFTITETLIKGLSETSLKIKKALTYKNINATFGRIVYAYPKNLPTGGELTSIKDQGTGWSVFDSYAKQEVTVDGIIYICYYLIDPAGFDGVTMIFA